MLSRGIHGSGETVVMPELASSPPSMDIRQDLATFDSKFGLPPANLHVVNTIAPSATSLSAKTAHAAPVTVAPVQRRSRRRGSGHRASAGCASTRSRTPPMG